MCELKEATVELFGRDDKPLPVPVFYRGAITRLLLAPHIALGMKVASTHTCKRNQVTRVQLSILGVPRPLSAPIREHHRFTPCQAAVEFASVFL